MAEKGKRLSILKPQKIGDEADNENVQRKNSRVSFSKVRVIQRFNENDSVIGAPELERVKFHDTDSAESNSATITRLSANIHANDTRSILAGDNLMLLPMDLNTSENSSDLPQHNVTFLESASSLSADILTKDLFSRKSDIDSTKRLFNIDRMSDFESTRRLFNISEPPCADNSRSSTFFEKTDMTKCLFDLDKSDATRRLFGLEETCVTEKTEIDGGDNFDEIKMQFNSDSSKLSETSDVLNTQAIIVENNLQPDVSHIQELSNLTSEIDEAELNQKLMDMSIETEGSQNTQSSENSLKKIEASNEYSETKKVLRDISLCENRNKSVASESTLNYTVDLLNEPAGENQFPFVDGKISVNLPIEELELNCANEDRENGLLSKKLTEDNHSAMGFETVNVLNGTEMDETLKSTQDPSPNDITLKETDLNYFTNVSTQDASSYASEGNTTKELFDIEKSHQCDIEKSASSTSVENTHNSPKAVRRQHDLVSTMPSPSRYPLKKSRIFSPIYTEKYSWKDRTFENTSFRDISHNESLMKSILTSFQEESLLENYNHLQSLKNEKKIRQTNEIAKYKLKTLNITSNSSFDDEMRKTIPLDEVFASFHRHLRRSLDQTHRSNNTGELDEFRIEDIPIPSNIMDLSTSNVVANDTCRMEEQGNTDESMIGDRKMLNLNDSTVLTDCFNRLNFDESICKYRNLEMNDQQNAFDQCKMINNTIIINIMKNLSKFNEVLEKENKRKIDELVNRRIASAVMNLTPEGLNEFETKAFEYARIIAHSEIYQLRLDISKSTCEKLKKLLEPLTAESKKKKEMLELTKFCNENDEEDLQRRLDMLTRMVELSDSYMEKKRKIKELRIKLKQIVVEKWEKCARNLEKECEIKGKLYTELVDYRQKCNERKEKIQEIIENLQKKYFEAKEKIKKSNQAIE